MMITKILNVYTRHRVTGTSIQSHWMVSKTRYYKRWRSIWPTAAKSPMQVLMARSDITMGG